MVFHNPLFRTMIGFSQVPLERTLQTCQHPAVHEFILPSPDRWANRTSQPVLGGLSALLCS
uniref:Uncharacterized protein n=1 Tax=Arundo donax TaxID=35708 RepID=A0A0A8YTS1_ARUDO